MKRLFLLLILAVACLFGVTSCGKEEEATPSQPQEQELTDQEKLDKAYSYLKQYYMNANSVTKNSYNVIANIPNATLTWSLEIVSGDETAVVLGTEKVTINKVEYYPITISENPSAETVYKLTATVSVGELSKQMVYERSVPAPMTDEITIKYLVENKPTGNLDEVFEVTGIWTAKDGLLPSANTYGNGFLSDEEGNKVVIYGLSGTDACLTKDDATGIYTYKNSKDFPTLGINDGAVIKVKMVYTVQYDNYSAYLVEIISNGEEATPPAAEPAPIETTIADLVANKPTEEKAQIYIVTGTWTAKDGMAPESNTYGNGFLSDDAGHQITIYGLSGSSSCVVYAGTYVYSNAKDFPTLGINDGDVIKVGMVYTPKFDNYSAYLIPTGGEQPSLDTVAGILAEGAKLADQAKLPGTLTITGTITEITAEYSEQYKNISFMLSDGTGEILVFRSKGDCAASLKVGDKVKVEGEVINYAGTIEFQYAALTLVEAGGTDEPVEPTPTVPVDPTNTSIVDALEIGGAKEHNTYTEEKYTLTGTVTNVYNTVYGNFYLKDSEGNQICIYGLYSEDGQTRYDAMTYKPVEGDVVTVTGILGRYNDTIQMKSGWLVEVTPHEHEYSEATCTTPATCSVCKGTEGTTLEHADDDKDHYCNVCEAKVGKHADETGDLLCDYCGEEVPADSGEPAEPVTASKTIAELISELGWTSTTTKQTFNLDENVTVKVNGGSNTGKAYNGDHIRVYATDTPAGTLTITLAEGYELVSVKVSAQTGTYAFLYAGDVAEDICNKTVAVSGSSVVLQSVKNGSDGKQVRITAIEVVYKVAE